MDPLKRVAEMQPARKAFSLAEEFKNFAFKGNIIDLAVGVIIGTAFAKIISSLVGDVLMPLITAFAPGDQQYKELVWVVNGKEVHYGQFLAELINFVLIALVLFVFIVKFLGWILRFRKEEAAVPPPPTKEQELLTEIRDLLKRTCPPDAAPSATPAGGAPSSAT